MPSQVSQAAELLAIAAPDATNTSLRDNKVAQANAAKHVNGNVASKPYTTSLPNVAITLERQPYTPKPNSSLIDPGTARVNIAASEEQPEGTPGWAEKHAHRTVLQQHCDYWDTDQDGIIYPWDIYNGCRRWGWNPILSLIVVLVISPAMSYPTLPKGKYLPSPLLPIYLDRIHKDKHGSDTNTYDSAGRFRPQQFEDVFAMYDAGDKGGLDLYDLARMWKGQRVLVDPFGWTAGVLEWLALYLLIWPSDGIMKKEDVRGSFDGSLFQKKADDFAERRGRKTQ